MGRSGDYHCDIVVEGAQVARTYTQYGTETPFWAQDFVFDDVSSGCHEVVVSLFRSVTQAGLLRKSSGGLTTELVGEIHVALSDDEEDPDLRAGKWLKMDKSDYDATIRIKLRHSVS